MDLLWTLKKEQFPRKRSLKLLEKFWRMIGWFSEIYFQFYFQQQCQYLTFSYKQKVTRLSAMVRAQPMKPAERLLKWSEFLAEFKTLDNLVPAGQKLNFYQYHSLDVIGFLFLVVLVVFYIGFLILKAVFRKCCRRRETKTKNDWLKVWFWRKKSHFDIRVYWINISTSTYWYQ